MVTRVSEAEIPQVWREYRAEPTTELRNRLIENYLNLVRYNAERIWARLPDGVDLDDLISAGIFGLMDAIEAFDLDRGVKFETYCVPRIRGAMLDELRTMDWVPRLVRSKQSKVDAAVQGSSKPRSAASRRTAGAGREARRADGPDSAAFVVRGELPSTWSVAEQEVVRDGQLQGRAARSTSWKTRRPRTRPAGSRTAT